MTRTVSALALGLALVAALAIGPAAADGRRDGGPSRRERPSIWADPRFDSSGRLGGIWADPRFGRSAAGRGVWSEPRFGSPSLGHGVIVPPLRPGGVHGVLPDSRRVWSRGSRVIVAPGLRHFDEPRVIFRFGRHVPDRGLSPGEVVDRLLRRGFERIELIELDSGLYRVYAVDSLGRRVRLLVDAYTYDVLDLVVIVR